MQLKDYKLEELLEEIERRKKDEVPKIVETINNQLEILRRLGCTPGNDSDDDYVLKPGDFYYSNGKAYYTETDISY